MLKHSICESAGSGKTLIAILLIKEIAEQLRLTAASKPIFFLAPSKALAHQVSLISDLSLKTLGSPPSSSTWTVPYQHPNSHQASNVGLHLLCFSSLALHQFLSPIFHVQIADSWKGQAGLWLEGWHMQANFVKTLSKSFILIMLGRTQEWLCFAASKDHQGGVRAQGGMFDER